MAEFKLPEGWESVEQLDEAAHDYAKAEGVTISQALEEMDISDQRLRNRITAAGAGRSIEQSMEKGLSPSQAEEYYQKQQSVLGQPSITGEPKITEYGFSEMGAGERRTTTPQGETITPISPGSQTATGRPIGAEQAPAGEVGVSPVTEGPAITSPGVKMPYVPGAGRMRAAMGGVTKGLETGEEIRRGQLTRIEEQGWKRRAELEEAKKYEIEKGRAETEVYQAQQTEFDRLKTQQIEKEGERQQYVKTEMSKIQGLISDMQTAKIDPTRFYRHPDGSANLPKTIAAAIAVGLGALGSSLPAQMGGTGGPNMALQIIDKAIDRDIAAQRDDIANRRAGVGLQMNALTQVQQMYDGERKQEAALKALMYETTKIQLQNIAMANPDQQVQMKYKEMATTLQAKIDAANDTLAIESYKESQAVREKQVGWEGTATQIAQRAAVERRAQAAQRAKTAAGAAPAGAHPTLKVLDPGYEQSLNPKTRSDNLKASQKISAAYQKAIPTLRKLVAWREKWGIETVNRNAIRQGNALLMLAKSSLRELHGTGARLDAKELELMGMDFDIDEIGGIAGMAYAVGLGPDPVLRNLETIIGTITDITTGKLGGYNYSIRGQGGGKPVSGGGTVE